MAIDYLTGGAQLPANGQDAVQGNPFSAMAAQFKSAPPEKKVAGLQKLAVDFPGGPQQVFGVDPTAPPAVPGQPTAEEPVGAWDRFLNFAGDNPQFMLELGAKLLAPRQENVSPFSHIASGLSTATDRLTQRKAGVAKAQLDKQETLAGISKTEGETITPEQRKRLVDSEIVENLRGPAPSTENQKLFVIRDSLRKKFPLTYPDEASATLGAQQLLDGGNTYDKFVSKYVTDNAFMYDDKAEAMADAKTLAVEAGFGQSELEQLGSKERAAAVRKNPNLLYDAMIKKYGVGQEAAIRAKVEQITKGKVTRKAPAPAAGGSAGSAPTTQGKPAPAATEADPLANFQLPPKPKGKSAQRTQDKQLAGVVRKVLDGVRREQLKHLTTSELQLAYAMNKIPKHKRNMVKRELLKRQGE